MLADPLHTMHKLPLSAVSAPPPSAHLSSAILSRSADALFVSGALGIKDGRFVEGTVADRFDQAMNNVRALLTEADATLSNVVAVTIYLKDLGSDLDQILHVFAGIFVDGIPPTRTIVETSALPSDTDVEVTCTAILGGTKHRLDLETMSSRGCSTSISIDEYMFVSGLAAPACSQGASFPQELHEIIDRLKSLLARNGMTVENISSVMIHLSKYNDDILSLNDLYLDELGIRGRMYKPTRTCVGVQALSHGRIELSCVAVRTHPAQQAMERPSDVISGAAPKPFYLDIAAPCPSAGLCWVSGAHAPGDTLEGSVADRTTFSLRWIEHALAAVQLTLKDVVSVTVYLTDYQKNFSYFNKAYIAGFPDPKPSRTCIGVRDLPQGTDVEITCIAAFPSAR